MECERSEKEVEVLREEEVLDWFVNDYVNECSVLRQCLILMGREPGSFDRFQGEADFERLCARHVVCGFVDRIRQKDAQFEGSEMRSQHVVEVHHPKVIEIVFRSGVLAERMNQALRARDEDTVREVIGAFEQLMDKARVLSAEM